MTIDVAIAHIRNEANSMKQHAEILCCTQDFFSDIEYHEQLAEWLEELKNIREENAYLHCEMQAIGATIDMLEEEIRNRAIDDYVERLKETYKPCKEADNYIYTVVCRRFDDIAQQLKAGGKNE